MKISKIKFKKIDYSRSVIYALIPLEIILCFLIYEDYTKISEITSIFQLGLFYGLFVYSFETLFLRKATENSLLYEQCPCLVLRTEHRGKDNYRLNIKNIGRGTALNVSVTIIDPKKDYSEKCKLYNNAKNLPVGDDKSIEFAGSKIDNNDPFNIIGTNLANQKEGFEVEIECNDASNNPMTSFKHEVKPGKGSCWEITIKTIGLN